MLLDHAAFLHLLVGEKLAVALAHLSARSKGSHIWYGDGVSTGVWQVPSLVQDLLLFSPTVQQEPAAMLAHAFDATNIY